MGKQGFRKLSELCYHKAHYAADEIAKLSGYAVHDVNPFFQEFVINCPVPARKVNETLLEHNILGGLDLSDSTYRELLPSNVINGMLVCVTEMNSKEDIDALVSVLKGIG